MAGSIYLGRYMRTIRFLPLAGVAAMLFTAACTEDLRSPVDPDATVPLFAPGLKECDTKAVSAAARDFFPREFDRLAKDLISDLGDACPDLSSTTDLAFDIMALMEMALGGVSELDASAGAALAIGLLPFMEFSNCEDSGCVKGGLDEFALDVLLALSFRGAFAVRGPGDLTGAVVSRDAEDTHPETDDQPVWGLTPGLTPTNSTSTWLGVLGERALLYGYPKLIVDACVPSVEDCPASDEQYSWNTLPDVASFGDQMVVGVCAEINNGGVNTRLRMQRNSTALENAKLPNDTDFDACTAFLPAVQTAGLATRLLQFLSPQPRSLVAFGRGTGPGGNASDFSDFTPLSATSDATLVIEMVADAVVGETIGPIYVTALTANGTPLERIKVVITPKDNNGSWKVYYLPDLPGGSDSCDEDPTDAMDCRYTGEEDGEAVFEGLKLDKTGGYRICASVKAGGNLDFTFPAEVCTNGFNVRPN